MTRGKYIGAAVTLLSLMAPGTLTVFAATSGTNTGSLTVTNTAASTVVSNAATGTTGSSLAGSALSGTTTYGTTYTVVQGDTFYIISQKTTTSLPALIQSNPQIANFDLIYPGEVIYLPQKYTMQPGDTLYKVAVAQNISLTALEAANPQIVDYGNMQPGQVINLPQAFTTVSQTATTAVSTTPAPTETVAVTTGVTTPPSTGTVAVTTSGTTSQGTRTTTTATTGSAASVNTSAPAQPASTQPASGTSATATRQNIVNYAKSLMGVPYAWGGSTPSTGFDCSGFVQYVFLHFGITLPRESHDQATIGTPVSQSNLQPGDLLFFKDTDSLASNYANQVTHVGIYIGNGSMVESTSVKNKGITIIQNVFSNSYYVAHYYGARNVIG